MSSSSSSAAAAAAAVKYIDLDKDAATSDNESDLSRIDYYIEDPCLSMPGRIHSNYPWWVYILVRRVFVGQNDSRDTKKRKVRTEIFKSQWPHRHQRFATLYGTPKNFSGTSSRASKRQRRQQCMGTAGTGTGGTHNDNDEFEDEDEDNEYEDEDNEYEDDYEDDDHCDESVVVVNRKRSERPSTTRKKTRSVSSTSPSFHICMILGPIRTESSAAHILNIWQHRTRSMIPRTAYGTVIAEKLGLRAYTDMSRVLGTSRRATRIHQSDYFYYAKRTESAPSIKRLKVHLESAYEEQQQQHY